MNDWFIVPLIGGLIFTLLGFVGIVMSIRKKEKLHPMALLYLFSGPVIFIISFINY
ncbi:hypothetical protein [Psychrobacillus phage Perkons]|nr:hypothetical protein [Psychrobacillus phage Perkons]